jgi:hypothetical protein
VGLRISEEEELIGVDIVEHGGHAYNDFQTVSYIPVGAVPVLPSEAHAHAMVYEHKLSEKPV